MKWVSRQFEFLEIPHASFSIVKNTLFQGKKRRNRLMNGRITINGRDEPSFDQNGAIILHPSDQRSKIKMLPRDAL